MTEENQRRSLMVLPCKTIDEACASFRGHLLAFQKHWKAGMESNPMGYPDDMTMPDWLDQFIDYMSNKSNIYKRVPVEIDEEEKNG